MNVKVNSSDSATASAQLRILVVHNHYRERGGEDAVVEDEVKLLQQYGHEVEVFSRHNDETERLGKLRVIRETFKNPDVLDDFKATLKRFRPHIVHIHNTWMRIPPAIISIAASKGIATVQTLHNFRLACPQALMLRNDQPCESCVGRAPLPAVLHRCYRKSYAQSALVAMHVWTQRRKGIYQHDVDAFISLTGFSRDKMIASGLPKSRFTIKPNFVQDPCAKRPELLDDTIRSGGLYVGRLSVEKGMETLCEAAKQGQWTNMKVIGTGDWLDTIRANPNLQTLGALPPAQVYKHMRQASYLVLPSICYENFPRTLAEAYANGLPVIASRMGVMPELIEEGRSGLLFVPGSAASLAERVAWAESHPEEMRRMGEVARQIYLERYTAKRNYKQLMDIYRSAIQRAKTRREATATPRRATENADGARDKAPASTLS